jgi:hypothetical protein
VLLPLPPKPVQVDPTALALLTEICEPISSRHCPVPPPSPEALVTLTAPFGI